MRTPEQDPGEFADLTQQQAENAFQIAQQVERFIMNHLKPYLDGGRPPDDPEAFQESTQKN